MESVGLQDIIFLEGYQRNLIINSFCLGSILFYDEDRIQFEATIYIFIVSTVF